MPRTSRLALLPSLLIFGATALPAQGLLHDLDGGTAAQLFGSAVAGVGDLSGDLVSDFVVGSPGADQNGPSSGRVTLFSGADGSVLQTWDGPNAGDRFGAAVAAAGDADGDGVGDILVGAPGAGSGAGAAWLLSGATGTSVLLGSGGAAGDAFGSSVAGAGHVNQNGYADLIIGAPGGSYARVLEGKSRATLLQLTGVPGDLFGAAVAGVGDVDGDRFGDIAIGAPGDDTNGVDAGRVNVYSGKTGAIVRALLGDGAGDALGTAVASAGDVDGDGVLDLIAGAPGDDDKGTDSGSARVFSGQGATLYTFHGDFAGDALGTAVAGAGDFDGDGFADLIAGAPGHDHRVGSDCGAARVLSGKNGAILATWRGSAAGDALGSAVACAGDPSGDGYADVIAGAPGDDDSGAEAGGARVFARKPFRGLDLVKTLTPARSGGIFGIDNEFVEDVNGDGVGDYAIGALGDIEAQGAVRVFSGADHSVIRTFLGGAANVFFGPVIGRAGDVDGDGHADVLTGAEHWNTVDGTGFNGRATLWSGRTGAIIWRWFGDQTNSHMGSSVGGLGDVDGDSVPDVFVGSLKQNTATAMVAGSVRAFSGATGDLLWETLGKTRGDWVSQDAEALGDVNGDGIGDVLVGAPQPATGPPVLPGYALVLSGADGSQIHRFNGLAFGDRFGWSVSRAGDVNGDGVTDALVGAYEHDPQGKISAGMARVYSGANGTLLYHLVGEFAGDAFGQFVNDAGDINGDGFDDFLVGAPGFDPPGAFGAGRAYLFSGLDGSPLQIFDGTVALQQFGHALTGIGDANGDGYGDLDIGAPQDSTAGPQAGAAYVFESSVGTDPGSVTLFGKACPTFQGRLPLLSVTGRPALGSTYFVNLNPLITEANPAGVLRIGNIGTSFARTASSPDALEAAPGCTVYTNRLSQIAFVPTTLGVSLPQVVPNDPALIGTEVYVQFEIEDPRRNARGRVYSNAARIVIGQ